MPRLTFSLTLPHPAEAVFRWHERPGAFERLVPPWDDVRVTARRGTIHDGDELVVTVRQGPLSVTWHARHEDYEPDHAFTDVQVRGPFARWRHVHRVSPLDAASARLDDEIEFRLPLHPLSQWMAGRAVASRLTRMFAFRHARTAQDLARHARFGTRPRLAVGILGADRAHGRDLAAFLSTGGHTVHGLSVVDGRLLARSPFALPLDAPAPPPPLDAVVVTAPAEGPWAGAHQAFDVLGRLGTPPGRLVVAGAIPNEAQALVAAAASTARDLGVAFAVASVPPLVDWVTIDMLLETVNVALLS